MQNRPEAENPQLKHETRDASIRTLIHWGIALALLLISGFAVGYGTFRYFTSQENVGQPPPSPFETKRTLPPEPRLQVNAPQDLRQYMNNEDQTLDNYGWVDKSAGIVRIPIDRAMDVLIQKGLLYRNEAHAKQLAASNTRSRTGSGAQQVAKARNRESATAAKLASLRR